MPPVVAAIGAFFTAAGAALTGGPLVLSAVAASGAAYAAGTAVGTFLASIGGNLLFAGLSIAAQYLLVKRPKLKPEFRSQLTAEPIGERIKVYGRMRVGGQVLVKRAGLSTGLYPANTLVVVIAAATGRSDRVEGFFVDGKPATLTLPAPGALATVAGYSNALKVSYLLGRDDQAAYPHLVSAFPAIYNADWRMRGITTYSFVIGQTSKLYEDFPQGQNTSVTMVGRFLRLYDPRQPSHDIDDEETWAWSANPALEILDHLKSGPAENGLAVPDEYLDIASFAAAATLCDQQVPGPLGTMRARFEAHGALSFAEQPSDGLGALLATCDGQLVTGEGGKIALSIGGVWYVPTVTLTEDAIVSLSKQRGTILSERVSVVKASYTSPAHGYVTTDAQEWVATGYTPLNRFVREVEFPFVHNHGQCRHLQKLVERRANARWQVEIVTNLAGIVVYGERFFRLRADGIDETFEVTGDVSWVRDDAGFIVGLSLSAVSMSESDVTYNELSEGAAPPVVPQPYEESAAPPAPVLAVTLRRDASPIGATVAAVGEIVLTSASTAYLYLIRQRDTSGPADQYSTIALGEGELTGVTGILVDGRTYTFEAQAIDASGRRSAWSNMVTMPVVYDAEPPSAVQSAGVSLDGSDAVISWASPPSSTYRVAYVRRAPMGSAFAASTVVGTIFGAPNAFYSYRDALGSGDWSYWVVAGNGSGVTSAEVSAGSVSIP